MEGDLSTKDLPRETLALIASFLSLEDKTAVCKVKNRSWLRAIADATGRSVTLKLPDADCLELIRLCRPPIETFELHMPAPPMIVVNGGLAGDTFFHDEMEPPIELDGEELGKAISGCSETLKCLKLFFGRDKHSRQIRNVRNSSHIFFNVVMDSGGLEAVSQCRALKSLEIYRPTFQSMEQLVSRLKPICQSLVILKLDYLVFGRFGDPGWRNRELLTNTIREMTKLEQLSLIGHGLKDEDAHVMIGPNSSNLKSLVLYSNRPTGLGDASLQAVADHCPLLEHLDFYGQQAGLGGWKKVLHRCPLKSVALPVIGEFTNFEEAVKLSSTLLVAWCHEVQRVSTDAKAAVISASAGRIVLKDYHDDATFIPPDGSIEPAAMLQQQASLARIQELEAKQKLAAENGELEFHWASGALT